MGTQTPNLNVGLLQAAPAPQAQELAQAGSAVISHLVTLRGNEVAGELGRLGATGSRRVRAGPWASRANQRHSSGALHPLIATRRPDLESGNSPRKPGPEEARARLGTDLRFLNPNSRGGGDRRSSSWCESQDPSRAPESRSKLRSSGASQHPGDWDAMKAGYRATFPWSTL